MYLPKSPIFLKSIYPDFLWKVNTGNKKTVFLTFDDGPTPGVTCEVLKILEKHDALATFFCVGKNVVKYPDLFNEIMGNGHSVGNHTFNHVNGWEVGNISYLRSIVKCTDVMPRTNLFRPPYGKIKATQAKAIANKFKVVMWDVISGDFDKATSKKKCLTNVKKYSSPGSIIVFHDSLKAKENVLYALPRAIEFFIEEGYEFSKIEMEN